MHTLLLVIQIFISLGIIVSILLQPQGSGLGSSWSGGGETFHTKRGVEKILYRVTISLVAFFALNGVMLLVVK